MQSERGLSNRECARELYFTGGSRLLLFLSPSFYATLTPFRLLSVPPLRDPLLSDSPSPSLSLVLSRACHKLHGQTGATGPRIYQYPIRACTFPPCLVLSRTATFLVYARSSPALALDHR